jgi:hypothetical protein
MSTQERRDRVRQLAQRFSHDDLGEWMSVPPPPTRRRKRHSVYIDSELMVHVDEVLTRIQHEIFPKQINKSIFLEKLLERGLTDVDEIVAAIVKESDKTPHKAPPAP